MVKKVQKTAAKKSAPSRKAAKPAALGMKGSAQQIWSAGLDALSKAQGQRTKALEALVAEGTKLQKKAQQAQLAAEGKLDSISAKAGQQWDKLESIFEERVAKALKRLGVPSGVDLGSLAKRIDAVAAAIGIKTAAKPAVKTKPMTKPVKTAAKAPVKKAATKPVAKAPVKKAVVVKKAAAPKTVAKAPVKAPVKKAAAKPLVKAAVKRAPVAKKASPAAAPALAAEAAQA